MTDIIKTTVSEEAASPYQSYPQHGDFIYLIKESDRHLGEIKEWCDKNTIATYRSFNMGNAMVGFWFAEDAELFEEEWL